MTENLSIPHKLTGISYQPKESIYGTRYSHSTRVHKRLQHSNNSSTLQELPKKYDNRRSGSRVPDFGDVSFT